jgi:chaperone modulatory protein CbpM
MMQLDAVIALFGGLEAVELRSWVERGWVQPDPEGGAWEFHDIDVARVRLILELRRELAVDEEAIPLVLSLLDQVYELRGTVRRLLAAVEHQPGEVRSAVLEALR